MIKRYKGWFCAELISLIWILPIYYLFAKNVLPFVFLGCLLVLCLIPARWLALPAVALAVGAVSFKYGYFAVYFLPALLLAELYRRFTKDDMKKKKLNDDIYAIIFIVLFVVSSVICTVFGVAELSKQNGIVWPFHRKVFGVLLEFAVVVVFYLNEKYHFLRRSNFLGNWEPKRPNASEMQVFYGLYLILLIGPLCFCMANHDDLLNCSYPSLCLFLIMICSSFSDAVIPKLKKSI